MNGRCANWCATCCTTRSSTARRAGRLLQVRLACEAGQARLSIADDGPGIPPALRERLFQPFAAGQPGSGSGLGLAICWQIVASLAGGLALEDRPSGGLDARVWLPLADNPMA